MERQLSDVTVDRRPTDPGPGAASARPTRLVLLGRFALLSGGTPVALAPATQSVLAFLALRRGRTTRPVVAATLWPRTDCQRARANLRSALWRIPVEERGVVVSGDGGVALAPGVSCDVWDMTEQAGRLADDRPATSADLALGSLGADLLPAWYDDWVLAERERLNQLRQRALESLCRLLTRVGRYAEAIDAGLAAVAAEPLREGGHRCLIDAHLAEGNVTEAVRQYDRYQKLLAENLAVAPSTELRAVVAGAVQG